MPNTTIQLKKSSTPSAKPANLANGELAINFADGKLYYKNTTSSIVEITPTQSSDFGTVSANGTLLVADTTGDVLTINPGNNISIVGDAVNDKVTISLSSDVVIPSTGTFKVAAVGNDEGGEIKLGNAITNSVVAGDVVIDVWQNHIRFFESGGTNRGAFINLALTGASVGTNLLATSGSTDTTARTIASSAFDKANAANVLAFNTGIGANAFTSATVAGANSFFTATIAGANTAVGTGANAFSSATIAGANTAVGTGANNFLLAVIAGANSAVGTGANNFMIAVQNGSNTAVGTGANNFASATIAGANTAVGTGANAFTSATIAGANTAVGNGANNYSNATFVKLAAATQTILGNISITGSLFVSGNSYKVDANTLVVQDPLIYLAGNNYTSDVVDIGFIANYMNATGQNVHTGLYREHVDKEYYLFQGYDKEPENNHIGALSNNMTLAVLNAVVKTSNLILGGANAITTITGVGTAANSFASATIAGANTLLISIIAGANSAVGTGANAFTSATLAGANSAVGTGANNFLLAVIAGANSAVGTGANNFMIAVQNGSNTAVGTGANAFTSATIAGANSAVGTGANAFTSATIAGANTAVGTAANNFAIATFGAANTRPVGNTLSSIFTSRSTRRTLNFIPGSNITINVDDDSAGDRSNVTIASTGGGGASVSILSDTVNATRYLVFANNTTGTLSSANVDSGLTFNPSSNTLTIDGALNAITKSFVIDHPTKNGMILRYGSLEGPENGVYVRGQLTNSSVIDLPDYWWALVDHESITVHITPYGSKQDIWIQSKSAYKINLNQPANCFFTVFAERKDVDKLIVEY